MDSPSSICEQCIQSYSSWPRKRACFLQGKIHCSLLWGKIKAMTMSDRNQHAHIHAHTQKYLLSFCLTFKCLFVMEFLISVSN